jgi:hypothetical protein
MKALTTKQQKEALDILHLLKKSCSGSHSDLVNKAHLFLQSIKPKYYIVQNQCGNFRFLATENWVTRKDNALWFETKEEAEQFILHKEDNGYEYFIATN